MNYRRVTRTEISAEQAYFRVKREDSRGLKVTQGKPYLPLLVSSLAFAIIRDVSSEANSRAIKILKNG